MTDYPGLLKAALEKLADGCTTPADVARKLADAGCTGDREDCYECPIATWLMRNLPGLRLKVIVGHRDVAAMWESADTYIDPGGALPEYDEEVTVDLPAVLAAFIDMFDGDYSSFPELARAD